MSEPLGVKVSICLPAYNQPESLWVVLNSIVAQDFKDYEVIVSDDSTNGRVKDMVEEFQSKITNLRYFKNEPRKGSPASWNEAIKAALGQYIKVLHHDDWFPNPGCLGKFVRLLEKNPQADFAFSATNVCNINGQTKYIHRASAGQLNKLKRAPMYLFGRNIVGGPSATIYRSKIVNKFYDPKLKWAVDVDQYIRILGDNNNFAYCSEPLISTTDGSPLQVTSQSLGITSIELFEWAYVYGKIRQKLRRPKHLLFIYFYLMFVLYRCDVKKDSDIEDLPLGTEEKHLLKTLFKFRILFFVFNLRRYFKRMLIKAKS